jgi:RNase adapter protein RapZ
MDLREKNFLKEHGGVFKKLIKKGYRLDIIFLDALEEVLLKRFSQTRRQHPAAENGVLVEGIRSERARLEGIKAISNLVIDTSNLTVHQLKKAVLDYVSRGLDEKRMRIGVLSFGFKYGVPPESDLLIDVRFIPNPYFIPELKRLDGLDERVRQFVKKWPETHIFMEKYFSLIEYLLPLYEKEGRSYLTISVGCTGGRHRSVTIAEELRAHISLLGAQVAITHRDIELV